MHVWLIVYYVIAMAVVVVGMPTNFIDRLFVEPDLK